MLGRLRHREVATITATELPPGTPQILVIDDDPDEAELIRDALQRAGVFYRVENASSADEGLDRLAEGEFEVALVDYRLGEWSGLDVLRKAQQQGVSTPMILLTGERDPDLDQAATSFGAVDFLKKAKMSPEELERSIRFAASNGRALTAARSAEARTAALEEIGRELGERGDAPEALDHVIGLLSESFERPFVSLYLSHGESFALASQRGHRASNQIIDREGPIGNALRQHRTVFVPNVSSHPDQRAADPQMELCLPLSQDSETFGLLLVGQEDNRTIAEAEHTALVSAASRISSALAIAQDRREVAARAIRTRRTHAFVARLAATPNAAELTRTLAEACAFTLEVTSATVLQVQGDSASVVSSFGPGVPAAGATATLNDLDRIALTEKRPASSGRETRTASGGLDRVWEASLPVARGGTVIALLRVQRAGSGFDVYEREAATFVAGLLGLILPA
jgi:CheY-like chemotaxis protein